MSRLYLPSAGTADLSPTAGAEWEHVNALRRPMSTAKAGSAFAATTYTPDAADHLVNGDALVCQFVSEPLAAQSIPAQTATLTVLGLEADNNNNLFLTWKLYLVNAAGTPVSGGTLVAIRRDGAEFPLTQASRTDGATTTAVTATAGDRLVLEIGLGGTPTAGGGTQGHNGSLRFGDPTGGADLAQSDGVTADAAPWLDLPSTTLLFGTPVTAVDAASASDVSVPVVAALAPTESVSVVDASTATASLAASDAAGAAEAASLAVAHVAADATGTEATLPTTGGAQSSLVEASAVATTTPVSAADAAAGGEAASVLAASLPVADATAGTDTSATAAGAAGTDAATVADAASPITAVLSPTDVGRLGGILLDDIPTTGAAQVLPEVAGAIGIRGGDAMAMAEAASSAATLVSADDLAAVSETVDPNFPFSASDAGAIAEASALAVAHTPTDAAAGADASAPPTASLAGTDATGSVADASSVLVFDLKAAVDAASLSDGALVSVNAGGDDGALTSEAAQVVAPVVGADVGSVAEITTLIELTSAPGTVGVAALLVATVGVTAIS